MILGGGTFGAAQTVALSLISQMKTRVMITAKVVTAMAGIGFNFLLGYWYGTSGVVFAGVVFSIFAFTWVVVMQLRSRSLAIRRWPTMALESVKSVAMLRVIHAS